MKSYLDLIPISAKVHRRQTRMTRLCILFSAFLVAAVFGMADMFLQSQKLQAIRTDGAWHAAFKGLNEEQIGIISARPDVETLSRYAAVNYRLDQGYRIEETETVVCGFDEAFLSLYPATRIIEGSFPGTDQEALVSEGVHDRLGLSVGDMVTLSAPEGEMSFQISGFVEDTPDMQKYGAFGIFLNADAYLTRFRSATLKDDFVCYTAFGPGGSIRRAIGEICANLNIPEDCVGENAKLMGLLLQSGDNYIRVLYLTAAILAVLVAFSGMLMILGSLNSNVAQRTEFFGMIRCIGATPRQVRRFVRAEALSWCVTAIPAGLASSVMIVWGLCGLLRFVSPTYFGEMPVFGISGIGLASGCVIGLLTVLAAARSPAKRASRVSPLEAVSGNAGTVFAVRHSAGTGWLPIEAALGFHHAAGSRKNLLLLTCSFGFSMILFLGFSTGIDFMGHALTPLRPSAPDVAIVSPGNTCRIPDALADELEKSPAVRRVFGRSFAYDLPAGLNGEGKTVNLISYEQYQFGWAKDDMREGSLEDAEKGEGVLLVNGDGFSAKTGDELTLATALGPRTVRIAGILDSVLFDRGTADGTVICSETMFRSLTGESGYTILDIQLKDKSDAAVLEVRNAAGEEFQFSDQRASNSEVRAVYYSFGLFVYGFLAVVGLIAAFNIINTIGMSVSARLRQYGAMRAIGTSARQLNRMVIAETASYMICGLAAGTAFGLPLHRFLYGQLITERWGDGWTVPFGLLALIAAIMAGASVAAVIGPMRKIKGMSVMDTISAR